MKICYFTYFNEGGASVHINEFAKAFKILNPSFKLFYIGEKDKNVDSSGDWWKTKKPKILSKFGHSPKRLFLNIKRLWNELIILNKEHPDVILARTTLYGFSIILLAKLKRIPLILEVNAPAVFESQRYDKEHFHFYFLAKFIDKTVIGLSDAVIVVSENLKRFIVKQYKVNLKKIYVNPNGVSLEKFSPSVNRERILSEFNLKDKTVIGFVGSFCPYHRVMDLVQVIYELLQEDIDVRLLLVGDGPLKETVEKFIKSKHLEKCIFLTGYVSHEEVSQYISAMDIAVLPNVAFYMSPIKLFEYMAMEKPVIAPDIGPLREIITQGKDGLLIREGKIYLKEALLHLIKNNVLREQMGINARRNILDKYTWEKNAQRVLKVCSLVYQKYYKSSVTVT